MFWRRSASPWSARALPVLFSDAVTVSLMCSRSAAISARSAAKSAPRHVSGAIALAAPGDQQGRSFEAGSAADVQPTGRIHQERREPGARVVDLCMRWAERTMTPERGHPRCMMGVQSLSSNCNCGQQPGSELATPPTIWSVPASSATAPPHEAIAMIIASLMARCLRRRRSLCSAWVQLLPIPKSHY